MRCPGHHASTCPTQVAQIWCDLGICWAPALKKPAVSWERDTDPEKTSSRCTERWEEGREGALQKVLVELGHKKGRVSQDRGSQRVGTAGAKSRRV